MTTFTNEPGKNYVTITVPRATAFDLVAVASVTSNHTGPLKLVVGSPVKVKYTAEDTSGNKATCTAFFQATGKQHPIVCRALNHSFNGLIFLLEKASKWKVHRYYVLGV